MHFEVRLKTLPPNAQVLKPPLTKIRKGKRGTLDMFRGSLSPCSASSLALDAGWGKARLRSQSPGERAPEAHHSPRTSPPARISTTDSSRSPIAPLARLLCQAGRRGAKLARRKAGGSARDAAQPGNTRPRAAGWRVFFFCRRRRRLLLRSLPEPDAAWPASLPGSLPRPSAHLPAARSLARSPSPPPLLG